MKKFLLGALTGLAVYKIVRSKTVVDRLKARASKFGTTVTDSVLEKLIERAIANGVTDEEFEDFMRIVSKVVK